MRNRCEVAYHRVELLLTPIAMSRLPQYGRNRTQPRFDPAALPFQKRRQRQPLAQIEAGWMRPITTVPVFD